MIGRAAIFVRACARQCARVGADRLHARADSVGVSFRDTLHYLRHIFATSRTIMPAGLFIYRGLGREPTSISINARTFSASRRIARSIGRSRARTKLRADESRLEKQRQREREGGRDSSQADARRSRSALLKRLYKSGIIDAFDVRTRVASASVSSTRPRKSRVVDLHGAPHLPLWRRQIRRFASERLATFGRTSLHEDFAVSEATATSVTRKKPIRHIGPKGQRSRGPSRK